MTYELLCGASPYFVMGAEHQFCTKEPGHDGPHNSEGNSRMTNNPIPPPAPPAPEERFVVRAHGLGYDQGAQLWKNVTGWKFDGGYFHIVQGELHTFVAVENYATIDVEPQRD